MPCNKLSTILNVLPLFNAAFASMRLVSVSSAKEVKYVGACRINSPVSPSQLHPQSLKASGQGGSLSCPGFWAHILWPQLQSPSQISSASQRPNNTHIF